MCRSELPANFTVDGTASEAVPSLQTAADLSPFPDQASLDDAVGSSEITTSAENMKNVSVADDFVSEHVIDDNSTAIIGSCEAETNMSFGESDLTHDQQIKDNVTTSEQSTPVNDGDDRCSSSNDECSSSSTDSGRLHNNEIVPVNAVDVSNVPESGDVPMDTE